MGCFAFLLIAYETKNNNYNFIVPTALQYVLERTAQYIRDKRKVCFFRTHDENLTLFNIQICKLQIIFGWNNIPFMIVIF